MQFRPMKGAKVENADLHLLKFPLYVSLKLDGIRCLVKDGKALTASLKPIPNKFTREFLESDPAFEGFDGELLLREPCEFNLISSAFMSQDGEPDFVYHVFDLHFPGVDFVSRLSMLSSLSTGSGYLYGNRRLKPVVHFNCTCLDHLIKAEAWALEHNYEGVMLRQPDLPYKFGKASIKQGHLLKRKPMDKSEAIIYGFEEGEENTNEATLNERGLSTRSSAKEGKIPNGTLGKLLVRNKRFGDFKIGTGKGLDFPLRKAIWGDQQGYLGRIIQFSFQEMGTLDKPRIPIYQNFRDPADMDPELVAELRAML
jgi:DNA ligase-1